MLSNSFFMLGNLPNHIGIPTRQISAENPTGEKGGGCKWEPDPTDPNLAHSAPALRLGRGWKVRPFIPLKADETVELASIQGPGCINHIFITSDHPRYRDLVLRFYWDHEEHPSVEVPLGDFFANGHDMSHHLVSSLPVTVGPRSGCNSYWPMPFRQHARITLQNDGPQDANVVAYRVLYQLYDIPEGTAYFHAQWRRSMTQREAPEHIIVDGVRGRGCYVGTYLAWVALSQGWWGEGEVKFYLDGDQEFPTLADNGTEDYFGGAWSFAGQDGLEQVYQSPFLGMPLAENRNPQGPRRFSLYRWHILDNIGFEQDLKVSVQALGWWPDQTYQPLADDIASVAYWYQCEPHAPFPQLPGLIARWGR
ncbi:MAG: glycoside hydrolase family 172 protein [Omnitrophica WOR_2 bacterium]